MNDKKTEVIKRSKYNAYDATKVFLYSLLIPEVTILAGIILSSIFLALMGKDINAVSTTMGYSVFLLLLSNATLLVICHLYNKGNAINGRKAMNCVKKRVDYKIVLFMIGLSIVSVVFSAPFINICDKLFSWLGYSSSSSISIEMNNIWQLIICIFVLAVIPAITEELVYRGVVQNGLVNTMGKKALIITALCFAIMHGVINQTIYQFVIGLLLCVVAFITGDIIYSIILHFLNNFIVLILSYVGQYYYIGFGEIALGWEIAISIAMFVIGVGLLVLGVWLLAKYLKKSKIKEPSEAVAVEQQQLQNMKRPLTNREKVYLIAGIMVAGVIWIYNTMIGFLG